MIITRKNLIFFILVLVLIFCVNLENLFAVFQHKYYVYDQDAYMHMVIATDFLKKHLWYSTINHRINAPFGADTHGWTHVVTMLLVSGASLLNYFMPQTKALYLWSYLLPMFFNGLAAFAMLWSINPLKPSYPQQLFILIAFLLNPFMHSWYLPLQVDYDFLLITLGIFYWGSLIRLLNLDQPQSGVLTQHGKIILNSAVESTTDAYCTDSSGLFADFFSHSIKNQQKDLKNQHISHPRDVSTAKFRIITRLQMTTTRSRLIPQMKWALVAGLIASLGIWTSIAFTIPVFIGLCILIQFTLLQQKIDLVLLDIFMGVLCFTIALILPIEHRFFLTISYDILSIVHLVFFLLVFLGLIFYSRYVVFASVAIKIILSFAILFMIFFIMNYLFPGFYYGPYNKVDPYLLRHFFPVLSEFYSPFRINNALALAILSYFFIGSGFYYYLYLTNKKIISLTQSILLFAAIVTTALAAYMYRWNEFATPLNILLVSFFVGNCCYKKIAFILQLIFIILMALLPVLILLPVKNFISPGSQHCQQQLNLMLANHFLQKPQFKDKKIIFTYTNYGPLILYYTHYAVVATNNHHNPQGIQDTFNFFTENESSAKKMIERRNVDLILICTAEGLPSFNLDKSTWLQSIALPKKYSLWRLYQPVPDHIT